jgi:predicted nucleic acid-binding protein
MRPAGNGDLCRHRLSVLAVVIDEAKRLSATHTLTGGHRGFDMLHVAAALQLKARHFLTFDANQKRLAEAEGLIVPF